MSSENDSAGDQPLVTLAVKAYRQEATVREAIESAFAQTYPNLEIILSDDCSSDGTFRVMQEMAAAYDGPHRVRLNRNPENLGVVGHENRLWELSTGQLFAHCAGDDIAEPERIERLVAAWRAGAGRVLLVHSAVMRIDATGQPLGEWRPDPRIVEDPSPPNVARTTCNHIGATALQDRRLYARFGPIPGNCGVEDGVQFFRATLSGEVAYVDEAVVRYRVGGLSDRGEVPDSVDYMQEKLYGFSTKIMSWSVNNARAFLIDMQKVDFPERPTCIAICNDVVRRKGLHADLYAATPLGRVLLLPKALGRSLTTRRIAPLRLALQYALGPLYVRYRRWRRGPRPT